MKLTNRVDKLAEKVADVTGPGSPFEAMIIADLERRIAFLEHVPTEFHRRVDARFIGGDEAFAEWRLSPFAKWATMPATFMFPAALVEFMLNPPARFFLAHACEQCGLSIPIFTTGYPDTPKDLTAFPVCPACGGKTSFAATYQTGANSPAEASHDPE
jgi:hypothetical protein